MKQAELKELNDTMKTLNPENAAFGSLAVQADYVARDIKSDKVKVFIKEINGSKIALSKKFAEENPWNNAEEKFAVGNVVKGKVARMTDFGAFIEIAPGVDALLHVSQISKDHVEKPSDVLSVGQEVEARIVDFNEEERKISLSVKALVEDSEESETEE